METNHLQQNDALSAADAFAASGSAHGEKQKHFVTAGEKKFDRRTYTGIGYAINAGLSVVAVAVVERTGHGQKMIENFSNFVRRHVPEAILKPEKAEWLARKTFFLTGGFLVLPFMKHLEDHKPELVKKWNREIYGAGAENDAQIRRSEQQLEAAPKQTWSSIFASRVLALVPFYVTYGALWDQKSNLSILTNPKMQIARGDAATEYLAQHPDVAKNWFSRNFNRGLREAKGKALDTFVEANPHAAAEGFYIDKPIAWMSRKLGIGAAKVTGGVAEAELKALEQSHPGVLRSATNDTPHDPVHSVTPYYVMSEAITSALVAWGVFVLTRVLGPIFDRKKDHTMQPVPWQPSTSAIPITETYGRSTAPVKEARQPETVVQVDGIAHQAPEAVQNVAR